MTNNTPERSGDELRAVVEDYGTPARNQLELTADEQREADEILAMDPLAIPGRQTGLEGRRMSAPTLETLNPEMRKEAEARLAALPSNLRAGAEAEVVVAVYRDHLPALRAASGLGEGATEYHHELSYIAATYGEYAREFNRLSQELAEVDGYRTIHDPMTGEAKPEPVLRWQGQQRLWRQDRMAELNHAMNLLQTDDGELGPEAQQRLRVALKEAAQARLKLKQAVDDKAEVERRAAAQVREDRIAAQVASRVRMMGGR